MLMKSKECCVKADAFFEEEKASCGNVSFEKAMMSKELVDMKANAHEMQRRIENEASRNCLMDAMLNAQCV